MSLYEQTIPPFIKYLKALDHLLDKGQEWCKEKGESEEDLLKYRLIADQRPLPYQVQSCSNTAKFVAQRVAGAEAQVWEDNEETFSQLHERISKTISFLQSVDKASFNGKEKEKVIMSTRVGDFTFETGQVYVSEMAIPNFHFHLSTAYCILRTKGVPIDAVDYLYNVFPKVEKKDATA